MNGVQYALRRVYDAEQDLLGLLDDMRDRHRADHEVFYVASGLRAWSAEHVEMVAERAGDHGVQVRGEASGPGPLHRATAAVGRLVQRPNPGVLLLEDLHDLYLVASHASLAWEMLAQAAQAQHQQELLRLTGDCHPQTLRQIRWANTMLKTLSPQLLSSL